MKRSRLVLLMLLAASRGHAAGINLSWDHCYNDGPAVVNKFFACDRNTDLDAVVASCILAASIGPGVGAVTCQALAPGFIPGLVITRDNSAPASGNVVNWQPDLPVAARNVTWGAVKALYR